MPAPAASRESHSRARRPSEKENQRCKPTIFCSIQIHKSNYFRAVNEQQEVIERRAHEARKALRREERRLEREDEGMVLADDSEHSVGEDDEGYVDSDDDVATMVSRLFLASSLTDQCLLFYLVFYPASSFKACERQVSVCSQIKSPSLNVGTQASNKQHLLSSPGQARLPGQVTTPRAHARAHHAPYIPQPPR